MMMDRRRGQAGDVTDQREGSLLTCRSTKAVKSTRSVIRTVIWRCSLW